MVCENCGGEVTWRGPIINLTHTQCANCGGVNCQIADQPEDDDNFETEDDQSCPPQNQTT